MTLGQQGYRSEFHTDYSTSKNGHAPTDTAVRPMARPVATRENTTVDPLCRRTDGARLPRADTPVTG